MNNVKFKVGDIVCSKDDNPLIVGGRVPLVIEEVYEDKDWNNRVGEIGCANTYRCSFYLDPVGRCPCVCQQEIVLWSERKNEVISKVEEYLDKLRSIG